MKTKSLPYLTVITLMLFLMLLLPRTVSADTSETASTIRLIHYEGDIQVEGAGGSTPVVMEGMRFNDGEALITGENSTASVSLDDSKILSIDSKSRVEFTQKGKKLKLTLKEGELFLDVKEKLGPEETLDIQTSTMAVGIRGTIVSASDRAAEDSSTGRNVDFKVLEGTTEVSWIDWAGSNQTTIVNAGEMLRITDLDGDGRTETKPVPKEMAGEDLTEFIKKQVLQDPSVTVRVQNSSDVLSSEDELFPADGDWTWDQPVTFIAQSASKLYDGAALTRPSDVLVNGLPAGMSFQASANGSQTDAGTGSNPISSYAIFNGSGDDVTKHFPNIDTVDGNLTVDPAPLTVWTGSASKVYDGTPLTAPETQIRTVPGYEAGEPLWRDTAYVGNASAGSEVLYGVCGTTWVHGTNPLTGEIREIELPAGKKMSVYLSDKNGEKSIEFRIEDMTEEDIPEELLRLYADNPDLLAQACKDTGWDIEILKEKIAELKDDSGSKVEKSDLSIRESSADRLMQDSTNVRIHIDTQITNYNGRALGNNEAHYTGVHIDDSIKIRATGSQTPVGQSTNTYEIDWGNANPNNYVFNEELGTLTVTPASLKVTTGSAEKEYDGKPLTNEEASLTGLVNGETANVTATGTVTEVGSTVNTYTIDWGTADQKNYSITEELGLLKITAAQEPEPTYDDPVTLTAATAEKVYDGITLTGGTVTAEGLPDGFTVTAKTNGAQTDAGSSNNEVSEYTIFDGAGKDVTAQFTNITTVKGTLTVTPAPLTITTGSAKKNYDGKPLTCAEVTVTGLVNGETADVTASGTLTDADNTTNTYTVTWGTARAENYQITEQLGTLTVEPALLTITTSTEEKVFDGEPLTGSASVTGLAEGENITLTAYSITDAGTADDTYGISWGTTDKNNYTVTEEIGTLTVKPLPVVFDLYMSGEEEISYVYSGWKYGPEWIDGYYDDENTAEYNEATFEFENGSYFIEFFLTGGGQVQLEGEGYADAGTSYKIVPEMTFTGGKEGNYDISFRNNEFDIEPLEIVFDLGLRADMPRAYNGKIQTPETIFGDLGWGSDWYIKAPLTVSENGDFSAEYDLLAKAFDLPGKDSLRLTGKGEKELGTYDLTPNYTISGNPDNYAIRFRNTTLVIEPAPLTITASASKPYDGTPLKGSDAIKVTGLAEGENITVTSTAEITDVGDVENPYTIDWGTVKKENYRITDETEETGTLTVTKATLTLTPTCTEQSSSGTSFVFNGLDLTVTSDASVAPDVTVSWNAWTDYAISTPKGDVSVQNNGGNTRWTVSVPGYEDEFVIQFVCSTYSSGDAKYIKIECIKIGGAVEMFESYGIVYNELYSNSPIEYPQEVPSPDGGNSDGNSSTAGKTSLSIPRKDSKVLQNSKEDPESTVNEGAGEASTDPEKDRSDEEITEKAASGKDTPEKDALGEDISNEKSGDSEAIEETAGKTGNDKADEGESADEEKTDQSGISEEKSGEKENKPATDTFENQGNKKDDEEQSGAAGDTPAENGSQAGSVAPGAGKPAGENAAGDTAASASEPGKADRASEKNEPGEAEASGQPEGKS